MLSGVWKNIEELEENINIHELHAMVKAGRDKELRHNRFMAAIKGINLDEDDDPKERFEAAKRRAEAKLAGKSTEDLEFDALGIEIIKED